MESACRIYVFQATVDIAQNCQYPLGCIGIDHRQSVGTLGDFQACQDNFSSIGHGIRLGTSRGKSRLNIAHCLKNTEIEKHPRLDAIPAPVFRFFYYLWPHGRFDLLQFFPAKISHRQIDQIRAFFDNVVTRILVAVQNFKGLPNCKAGLLYRFYHAGRARLGEKIRYAPLRIQLRVGNRSPDFPQPLPTRALNLGAPVSGKTAFKELINVLFFKGV